MRRGLQILVGLGLAGLVLAAPAWAAQPAPGAAGMPEPIIPASSRPDPPGTAVLAAVGAGLGTAVYAPFKAVVLCPVMAAAAGVSQLLPVRSSTPRSLLRLGCGGTYLITPEMVRGAEEFHGGGDPLVQPAPVRPIQRAEAPAPASPRTP